MKVYILGSNAFMHKMVEVTDKLIGMGIDAHIADHYRELVAGTSKVQNLLTNNENVELKRSMNTFKLHYDNILKHDAILVINDTKHGIDNYIGGNVLVEMGQAYVHDKKIFFLNGLPAGLAYLDEILAMDPICLEGNLTKLK
jgi:hypothetical protein